MYSRISLLARTPTTALLVGAAAVASVGATTSATLAPGAAVTTPVAPRVVVAPLVPSDANAGDGGAIAVNGNAAGYNTDSTSRTVAHNSGGGGTAVNSAGNGQAHQYAEQPQLDTSRHNFYENRSRTDSHATVNSHNSSSWRDSHATDVHQPTFPPPYAPF